MDMVWKHSLVICCPAAGWLEHFRVLLQVFWGLLGTIDLLLHPLPGHHHFFNLKQPVKQLMGAVQ